MSDRPPLRTAAEQTAAEQTAAEQTAPEQTAPEQTAPELPFPTSACHSCAAPPRYIRTQRSIFILCPLLPEKYPRQPVARCPLYRPAGERRSK